MAGEVTRISREKYEAGMTDARDNYRGHGGTMSTAIGAFLAAVGIEVEPAPEERVAAFVADLRKLDRPWGCGALRDVVGRHFPEVCGRAE
jgi:hypothetical protein